MGMSASKVRERTKSTVKATQGLNSFLHETKKSFPTWIKKDNFRVGVVMGNEASDLDSIISSTLYAYYLHSHKRDNQDFIPLMNIPREDFKLRTETNWLFQDIGVTIEDIVFLPEVQKEFDLLHESKRLDLILVDHNRLAVPQEKYENSVSQIVDHHVEENKCPNAKVEQRTIELVGSCATLVAEKILKGSPSFLSKTDARLLLGPILLDTVNLDPKHKKVTKKDEEIAEQLFKISESTADLQKQFFEKLQAERFSVDSLNTYDLLRCDYKQWTMGKVEVGVGACKKPLHKWLQMDPDLPKEFQKYLKGKKLDILFAMTQHMDDKNNMFRELIVFTPDKELYEGTKKFLLASDLKLVEIETDKAESLSTSEYVIAFFNQENVAASRKQLQPLLVKHYEK